MCNNQFFGFYLYLYHRIELLFHEEIYLISNRTAGAWNAIASTTE